MPEKDGIGDWGEGGGGSGGEGRVMMVRSERECQRNKWTRKFWKCLIETAQGYYFSLFSNTLPLVKQTRVLEGGTPIQYPYVPGDRVWYFSEVPDPQTVSGFKTLRGLHLAAICGSTPRGHECVDATSPTLARDQRWSAERFRHRPLSFLPSTPG